MLTVQYFASIREALDKSEDSLPLPAGVTTVAELQQFLGSQDAGFAALLDGERQLLVAVNQTIVDGTHTLNGDEEVAFFPPMTGG